jgi:TonB family protein
MRAGLITASLLTTVAAALAAPAPAAAAQDRPRPPPETVGDWEVQAVGAGSCAVARRYADSTRLSLFASESGYRTLSVLHPAWMPVGRPSYRFVLLRGGERRELEADDPRYVGGDGLYMPLNDAQLAEVTGAQAIEVIGPEGRVLKRLDLAGLGAAAARLPACFSLGKAFDWPRYAPPPPPPPPPRGRMPVPARAKVPLYRLITVDDYPAAALRAEEEGMVGFRLDIDKEGRVVGCAIAASSGSPTLDSATCRLMRTRAAFEPARDRNGKRIADSVSGRILWKLEDPPPEPEPPSLP